MKDQFRFAIFVTPFVWLWITSIWMFHPHRPSSLELVTRQIWLLVLPALFVAGLVVRRTRRTTFIAILSYGSIAFCNGLTWSSVCHQLRDFTEARLVRNSDKPLCPKNLEQCFSLFDQGLTFAERLRFQNGTEDGTCIYGGSAIADPMMVDVIGKWDMSELIDYFEKMGITDLRDVTSILYRSYWRHLHNKPIELERQVRFHRSWWELEMPDVYPNTRFTDDLLNYKFVDQNGKQFSISGIKGKLKLFAQIDDDGVFSAMTAKFVKEFRKTHPSPDLAVVVCVAKFPKVESKPSKYPILFSVAESKAIAAFQAEPGDIKVAKAPDEFVQLLGRFCADNDVGHPAGPHLIVINGDGFMRIHMMRTDKEIAIPAIEKEMRTAGI